MKQTIISILIYCSIPLCVNSSEFVILEGDLFITKDGISKEEQKGFCFYVENGHLDSKKIKYKNSKTDTIKVENILISIEEEHKPALDFRGDLEVHKRGETILDEYSGEFKSKEGARALVRKTPTGFNTSLINDQGKKIREYTCRFAL